MQTNEQLNNICTGTQSRIAELGWWTDQCVGLLACRGTGHCSCCLLGLSLMDKYGAFLSINTGPTKTSEMDPLPILVPVPDFHPGSHPVSGFFSQKPEIWKQAGQMWKTGQDISCQFLTLHGIIYAHWTLCLAVQLGHGNMDLCMPFCRWPGRTLHLKTGFSWHRLYWKRTEETHQYLKA
jgi:hypothetical protein